MKIILYLSAILLLTSCINSKKGSVNQIIAKQVYLKIDYGRSEENQFVDSNVNITLAEFNKRNKTMQIHLYEDHFSDSPNIAALRFSDLSFASDDAIIAGYITSAVGLIATPLVTMNNSNNKFLLAFWYTPRDFANFDFSYRNFNSRSRGSNFMNKVHSGSLFRSKHKRGVCIAKAFRSELYHIFSSIDFDMNHKKRTYRYEY